MKLLRQIVLTFLLLVVAAYLVVAVTTFNHKPKGAVCRDVELVLKDTLYGGLITKPELLSMLEKEGIRPIGQELDLIPTRTVERILLDNPLIERVECYKTPGGTLRVEATQRTPLVRVMSDGGENYYIDNHGKAMPASAKTAAHLVVATGSIEKSFAMRNLYKFGVFLQRNSFWNAQIEQIHVLPKGNVELVPRVGDHLIYLGKLENYEEKLSRLKTFYEKGLNRVGWNKYSRIDVEFSNQIICTKR